MARNRWKLYGASAASATTDPGATAPEPYYGPCTARNREQLAQGFLFSGLMSAPPAFGLGVFLRLDLGFSPKKYFPNPMHSLKMRL